MPKLGGAHFQLEMHDALKSSAFASPDPTYFNRLFTLLLDNSIKYAPGSEITLTASIEDGNQLALDFADNGPGFGVADPSLLFEPYQRGESAEGVAGTGMGLWSVKTIVQMMKWQDLGLQATNRQARSSLSACHWTR